MGISQTELGPPDQTASLSLAGLTLWPNWLERLLDTQPRLKSLRGRYSIKQNVI